jgi:hypothetical protein
VEMGKITQEQADEFSAWLEARPNIFTDEFQQWLDSRPDVLGIFRHHGNGPKSIFFTQGGNGIGLRLQTHDCWSD